MPSIFGSEFLYGYPIPEDGISFGSISANGITALLEINGLIVSGSISYPTLTVTLKGIAYPPPIPKQDLTVENVGSYSFTHRDIEYKVLSVSEGARFKVGNDWRLFTWSVTGVDVSNLRFSS